MGTKYIDCKKDLLNEYFSMFVLLVLPIPIKYLLVSLFISNSKNQFEGPIFYDQINFDNMYYRNDIGKKGLAHLKGVSDE